MKRTIIYVIIPLILLGAAFTGVYRRYFHSPLGKVVVDIYFQGIILDPAKYPVPLPPTSTWEITPRQVRTMESKLAAYVEKNERLLGSRISNELRYYRRHYLGLVGEGGRKMINIYFCHEIATTRDDWLEHHLTEKGGGDAYWHITYEVGSGWLGKFFCNDP